MDSVWIRSEVVYRVTLLHISLPILPTTITKIEICFDFLANSELLVSLR